MKANNKANNNKHNKTNKKKLFVSVVCIFLVIIMISPMFIWLVNIFNN